MTLHASSSYSSKLSVEVRKTCVSLREALLLVLQQVLALLAQLRQHLPTYVQVQVDCLRRYLPLLSKKPEVVARCWDALQHARRVFLVDLQKL